MKINAFFCGNFFFLLNRIGYNEESKSLKSIEVSAFWFFNKMNSQCGGT